MLLRELVVKLGFDVDLNSIRRFDNAIRDAKQDMGGLLSGVEDFSRGIRNVGLGLSVGLTLPITLLGKSFIQAASDAEETGQRFDVVFRDIREGANRVSSAFAKDFALAADKSRELLGTTGDLLTGFGFTQERALSLADRVGRLGGDLASFNHLQGGTEEAVTRLTKGILGETENLKLLGVVVNQGTKDFKQRVKTLQETTGVTLQQAKAETILAMAVEQSKNAIGDFSRTSESFANRSRTLLARLRDLQVSFGDILLPTATKVLGVFIKLSKKLKDLSKPVKKTILIIAGIAAAIGPVLLIVGSLVLVIAAGIKSFILIKGVLLGLGITFGAFSTILFKVVAVIALIGLALFFLIDDMIVWAKDGESIIGEFLGPFDKWKKRVMKVLHIVKVAFLSFWRAVTENSDESWDSFTDNIIKGIKLLMDKIPKLLFKLFIGVTAGIGKLIAGAALVVINGIKAVTSRGFNFLKSIFKRIPGAAGSLADGLTQFAPTPSAPVLPPSDVLGSSSLGGAAPSASNSNVVVNQTNEISVPPGTSEQQKAFLEETAKQSFDKFFNSKVNDALIANPRSEK